MPPNYKENRHIELFPGSKSGLEDLTGNTYEKITDKNGNLLVLSVEKTGVTFSSVKMNVDAELAKKALEAGADAIIHLTYVNGIDRTSATWTETALHGFGYAVKKVR